MSSSTEFSHKKAYFCLYSAGGHARDSVHYLEQHLRTTDTDYEILFIDDDPGKAGQLIGTSRIISYQTARHLLSEGLDLSVNVAFGSPALRKQKYLAARADGFRFFPIQAASFFAGPRVVIGDCPILSHNTTITCDATVGVACHLNIYSYITHDCIVGDFVTFAPRVSVNGRVKIENDVFIGSGATFLPGNEQKFLTIGEGAIIGAGALVTKDVEPGTTVVGVPARPLAKTT